MTSSSRVSLIDHGSDFSDDLDTDDLDSFLNNWEDGPSAMLDLPAGATAEPDSEPPPSAPPPPMDLEADFAVGEKTRCRRPRV